MTKHIITHEIMLTTKLIMLSITVGPISTKVKFNSGFISEFHASPLKINVWETLIQEDQGYSGNVTLASYHM